MPEYSEDCNVTAEQEREYNRGLDEAEGKGDTLRKSKFGPGPIDKEKLSNIETSVEGKGKPF